MVLLAGGTGITPMFQIASAALRNPDVKSHVTLLSFSKHDQDVCLYQELIDLQAAPRHHPSPVSSVAATISSALNLKFFASELSAADTRKGFIKGSMRSLSAQQLLEHIGAPVSETTCFCMCGPRYWITATHSLLRLGGVHESHMFAW